MQPQLRAPKTTGSSFIQDTRGLWQPDYQRRAVREVLDGHHPDFMRKANFVEIVVRGRVGGRDVEARIRACRDHISVGTDSDYTRLSMSALDGQRVAERFGCVLPTEKLVEIIDQEARKRGTFLPFHAAPEIANRVTDPQSGRPLGERWNPNRPSGRWIMSADFSNTQSRMTDQDIQGLRPNGAPIYSGHKKETVYHPHLVGRRLVAFYRPPLTPHKGWLPHEETYFDYSQGVRLIDPSVTLVFTNSDGSKETLVRPIADILGDNLRDDAGNRIAGSYALIADNPMDITRMYRSAQSTPFRPGRRGPVVIDEINQ